MLRSRCFCRKRFPIRLKTFLLIAFFSTIFYSSLKRFLLKHDKTLASSRRKLVILFSNKRSGSSFAGELFNQNSNSFYLFEPLFPFTRSCDSLGRERVETLKQLLNCNFDELNATYTHAFDVTKHTDKYAKCAQNNLCFVERHEGILKKLNRSCAEENLGEETPNPCEAPISSDSLSSLCQSSPMIALKILRVCDLSTLREMVEEIQKLENVDLKIVHLIRDPRAILSSRLQLREDETESQTLAKQAQLLCDRLEKNLIFVDDYWKDNKNLGLYLQVRYEELASQQMNQAQKIYDFIGNELPSSVKLWLVQLEESQKNEVESTDQDPFSLQRKSDVISAWRSRLGMKEVLEIQRNCRVVLNKLSYIEVNNADELRDYRRSLFKR